jgi:hypothetical protein
MNLLYQGGKYQWIRYKTYANTEGKLMARFSEFHRQQRSTIVSVVYDVHLLLRRPLDVNICQHIDLPHEVLL